MVKNQGQIPQYYVENSHPAIVPIEVFEMVQAEIAKNRSKGAARSGFSHFSDRIVCGTCGEYFGSKTWNSTSQYRRNVWQCNGKYRKRGSVKCSTPHLDEPTLERIFVEAINKILSDREEYIAALQPIIDMISDTYDIDSEALILGERSAGLYARLEALVADNAQRFQDQNEYRAQYAEMEQRYESVKAKLAELEEQKQSRLVRREKILQFIETVHQRETLLTEFDEALFRATVECITVHTVADIRVKFRDGSEVKIDSRQKRYTEQ